MSGTVTATVRAGGGWFVNNAGWVRGPHATVVIDAMASEHRTSELLQLIQQTADADAPMHLLLTHAHGDHTNGAYLFEQVGAAVWASPSTAAELTELGIQRFPGLLIDADWGAVRPVSRVRHAQHGQRIDTGQDEVEFRLIARPAHSDGDVVAWLPRSRVLFSGDLVFAGVTPLAVSGSVTGWLKTLPELADLRPSTIVPGHGPVGGPELLDDMAGYLRWIVACAERVVAGADPFASVAGRGGYVRWRDWPCPERDVVNVIRAVADISSSRFDFAYAMGALRDAHGGPISAPG